MVMRPEPIAAALDAVAPRGGSGARGSCSIPGGGPSTRRCARELARPEHLVLVCPRYEGVDDRVRGIVDLELSIGDYVLSGGELPALVVIDAVLRLLPGAIDEASPVDESFADGLLEYPQYTRPPEFRGQARAPSPAQRPPRRGRPLAPAQQALSGPGASGRTCSPRAARAGRRRGAPVDERRRGRAILRDRPARRARRADRARRRPPA